MQILDLLFLFLLHARAEGVDVVIAALPAIQVHAGQAHHVLPLLVGQAGLFELATNFTRHHKTLPLGPANHCVGDFLQGGSHGDLLGRTPSYIILSIFLPVYFVFFQCSACWSATSIAAACVSAVVSISCIAPA